MFQLHSQAAAQNELRMTRPFKMDDQQGARLNKGASFIKALDCDFSNQLPLPEDFTMNMNGYMPHRFIIESGITKKCWRVEVQKDGNGRMYFRDGWSDFVEAHSLEAGNFLLFEYEEQSIFQVRIFGRNGCEKSTILVDSIEGDKRKPQKENDDNDNSEYNEELESEPVIVKCHEPKTPRLAPRKFGRTGIHKIQHPVRRAYIRTAKVSVTEENNMCFSVTIHHRKKHQFYQLTVPKEIILKMNLQRKDEVKLQDAQGNSWNVKLAHRRDGRVAFSQGWKEFVKDKMVSHRDKLQFVVVSEELIQVHVKSSKVEMEHNESDKKDGKLDQPSSTCAPKDQAIETPETSKRKNFYESDSSFSYTWNVSSYRTYLSVPTAIGQRQNLTKKDNVVLRDPEGKCWPLEVKRLTRNSVALAKGWVEFCMGHNLNDGDVLDFEFVSENLMQVNIKKVNKPLHEPEPELEDEIIFLGAMDTESATVMEPKVDISHQKIDAEIEPEVYGLPEGFDGSVELELDAADPLLGANDAIN